MENPFDYIPQIATVMKEMNPSSELYARTMKTVMSDKMFVQVLMDMISKSTDEDILNERHGAAINADISLSFIRISILSVCIGLIVWLFKITKTPLKTAIIFGIAAVVAIVIVIIHLVRTSKMIERCVAIYLNKFIPCTDMKEEDIMLAIRIKVSVHDVISKNDLKKKIPCGCYHCTEKFTSEKLISVEDDDEYHCPVCRSNKVISERCGYEITDEVLKILHDYWDKRS